MWHLFVKITFFVAKHCGKLLNQQMLENLSAHNRKTLKIVGTASALSFFFGEIDELARLEMHLKIQLKVKATRNNELYVISVSGNTAEVI